MRTGKIKWFNADKGYGFIEPDDKSKDVFLHVSELAKTGLTDIKEGEKRITKKSPQIFIQMTLI